MCAKNGMTWNTFLSFESVKRSPVGQITRNVVSSRHPFNAQPFNDKNEINKNLFILGGTVLIFQSHNVPQKLASLQMRHILHACVLSLATARRHHLVWVLTLLNYLRVQQSHWKTLKTSETQKQLQFWSLNRQQNRNKEKTLPSSSISIHF